MSEVGNPGIDGPVFWVFTTLAGPDVAINPTHIVAIYPQIESATIQTATGEIDVTAEVWDILDQYGRYWAP